MQPIKYVRANYWIRPDQKKLLEVTAKKKKKVDKKISESWIMRDALDKYFEN